MDTTNHNTSDTYVPSADDQGGATTGAFTGFEAEKTYRYAHARVIIVTGPQGCGKSRMKDRILAYFKAEGFTHDTIHDGDGAIWRYGEVLTAGLYLTNTSRVIINSLDIYDAVIVEWDDLVKLIPKTSQEQAEEFEAWVADLKPYLRPNRVAAITDVLATFGITNLIQCPDDKRYELKTALIKMNAEADRALGWSIPTDRIFNLDDYQEAATHTWRGALPGTPWGLVHLLLQGTSEEGESVTHFGKSLRDDPETLKSLMAGGPWVLSPERQAAIKKELGDKLWYIAAIAKDLGWSLSEIAQANVFKTRDRQERNVVKGDGDNR